VGAAGIEWKALYAGRCGTGTVLRDLAGNLVAAQQVLGHETLAMTDGHYALPSTDVAEPGLKLLEAEWRKELDRNIKAAGSLLRSFRRNNFLGGNRRLFHGDYPETAILYGVSKPFAYHQRF
jgi:hypothetical protein